MIIGKNTLTNENVEIDLVRLISTRLLIQANSGGGKSWLIRRLLEQTHGKVQQLVIDLEGEFSTLREDNKYDYLLVGKDGEIPANIQTAELLAIKLLKLNVSTILDLSELKHHERIIFVKRFLDSLVNAPRELWHTCLIIVDEAHQFCPEGKMSESGSSVIDLMTRGRKRGFCGVLATQRIAKLHKDAAAECNNVLVGRTVIDIDRKRASNDLGFTTKEQEQSLKKLDDGEFFGYGPAISKEDYIKVKVGEINTTHPEPGKNILKASETPDNIKKLLKDVIDLPKEAEEELKTKKDFQNKILELKKELRISKAGQPKTLVKTDEKAIERAFGQGVKEAERTADFIVKKAINTLKIYQKGVEQIAINCSKLLQKEMPKSVEIKFERQTIPNLSVPINRDEEREQLTKSMENTPAPVFNNHISEVDNVDLGICARKIYSFLYNNPDRSFTKSQIGAVTGYSQKSGGFGNSLYRLNTLGLIEKRGNIIKVKEMDSEIAGEYNLTKEAILDKLSICPKKIYQLLLNNPYEEYSKEDIAEEIGYSASSGGFGNSIYKLNTLGLIEKTGNIIKLNPEILELA